jgi:hypothetical protein
MLTPSFWPLAWNRSSTSLLGYNASKAAGKLEEYENDSTEQEEAEAAEEDDDAVAGMPKTSKALENLGKSLGSIFSRRRPDSTRSNMPKIYGPYAITNPIISLESGLPVFDSGKDGPQGMTATTAGVPDVWDTLKVATAFESLTAAADFKRARNSDNTDYLMNAVSDDQPRSIIVQVRDYKELISTLDGTELIGRLRQAVNKRWQAGKRIILVGTTSTEEAEPALSKSEIQRLQEDIVHGEKRTIFVPPDRREEQDVAFEVDEKARVRLINMRHMEDMILKLAEGTQHLSPAVVDLEKDLDSATVYSAGLEDAVVWTLRLLIFFVLLFHLL